MRQSQNPFRDPVVILKAIRRRGPEVTVLAPRHGPRFRAYVHTHDWERVLAVSTAESAEAAAERAEAVLAQAVGAGRGSSAGCSPSAEVAIHGRGFLLT